MMDDYWPEVSRSLLARYDGGFCIDRGGMFVVVRDREVIRRFPAGTRVSNASGAVGTAVYVDKDGLVRVKWDGGGASREKPDAIVQDAGRGIRS